MKNLLILCIVFLSSISIAQKPIKCEAEIGVSLGNMMNTNKFQTYQKEYGDEINIEFGLTKNAGLRFYIPINRRFAFYTESIFSNVKMNVIPPYDNVSYQVTKNYIDLSVGATYNIYKNIFIIGGPSFTKQLAKLESDNIKDSNEHIAGVKYGILFGIGKKLFIKTNFHSIIGMSKSISSYTNIRSNGTMQLSVGYMIF